MFVRHVVTNGGCGQEFCILPGEVDVTYGASKYQYFVRCKGLSCQQLFSITIDDKDFIRQIHEVGERR